MRFTKATAAVAFFLLLFASVAFSSNFSLRSLSVFIRINQDGSANVEEHFAIMMNSSLKEFYEDTRSIYSDLATWRAKTGIAELRHHISRAYADIRNLRLVPQPVERCNLYVNLCHATLLLAYDVPASKQGSGLVKVDWYKPRTAKYSIEADALSFERTKSGDLLLPPNTNITFAIPPLADRIYFSAIPENIADQASNFRYDYTSNLRYYVGQSRIFNWRGEMLSKFQFTFEIEFPLETEVIEFFKEAQTSVLTLFFGPQGLAALIILSSVAATIYFLNKIERQ
ncbi:MAG: hypothetical protein N3G80_04265 [Candidatus Micrarchaeota archaeon]|nr:hypothetical protein [Candidatus Micrarchaeota archaeon]